EYLQLMSRSTHDSCHLRAEMGQNNYPVTTFLRTLIPRRPLECVGAGTCFQLSEGQPKADELSAAAVADRGDAGEHIDPVVERHALADLEAVPLLHPADVRASEGSLHRVGGVALAGMR